jgi:hypothetical protein
VSLPVLPPSFSAEGGYQLRTRLPRPGGRIDTPELNGFRYAGRLRFRPRASLQHEQAHQSTQVRLFLRSGDMHHVENVKAGQNGTATIREVIKCYSG